MWGKDREEHNQQLTAALKRINEAEVILNRGKREFRLNQLKFLGHVIDKDSIRADPDKTAAIRAMKPPAPPPNGDGKPVREILQQPRGNLSTVESTPKQENSLAVGRCSRAGLHKAER